MQRTVEAFYDTKLNELGQSDLFVGFLKHLVFFDVNLLKLLQYIGCDSQKPGELEKRQMR